MAFLSSIYYLLVQGKYAELQDQALCQTCCCFSEFKSDLKQELIMPAQDLAIQQN